MAKKEETISLIDTFSEFKELKNIDNGEKHRSNARDGEKRC